MSFIVTGAAGFIGANIVRGLNQRGITDILAVDNLTKSDKFTNLADTVIADYLDKRVFIDLVKKGEITAPEAIFHQGACSDTMELDGHYMMENNYRYTLELFNWCQAKKIPFFYASSAATYGASSVFVEDVAYEKPLKRLRLLQVPLRPSSSQRNAERPNSPGCRSSLLQCIRPYGTAQRPYGFRCFPSIPPIQKGR